MSARFSVRAANPIIVPKEIPEDTHYIDFDALKTYPLVAGHKFYINCTSHKLAEVIDFLKEWSKDAPAAQYIFHSFEVPEMLAGYGMTSGDCSSMLRAACIRTQPQAKPASLAGMIWSTVRSWNMPSDSQLEIRVTSGSHSETFRSTIAAVPKARGRKASTKKEPF